MGEGEEAPPEGELLPVVPVLLNLEMDGSYPTAPVFAISHIQDTYTRADAVNVEDVIVVVNVQFLGGLMEAKGTRARKLEMARSLLSRAFDLYDYTHKASDLSEDGEKTRIQIADFLGIDLLAEGRGDERTRV